jgi:3-hydroxypropionyl-coenzyme A dehydratase
MSSEMKYLLLDLQAKDEGVAIIKINRPEVLNALNREAMSELSAAIDIVSADDKIKVLIITGSGERSFCAGADIRYVVNIDPIEAEKYATFIHGLLNKIENLEKPVIAAVNGYALGGGCELALACDIRIASSRSYSWYTTRMGRNSKTPKNCRSSKNKRTHLYRKNDYSRGSRKNWAC